MEFALKIAFLLLVVTGAVTADRHSFFFRPRVPTYPSYTRRPAKPAGGDTNGLFSLADAFGPDSTTAKPSKGNNEGFKLEHALAPAGGDFESRLNQKMDTVIHMLYELQRQKCQV